MEHLFIISIGILMMILFFPHTKGQVCVDGHIKLFLYIFGILSVLGIIKNFKKEHSSSPSEKKVDVFFFKWGNLINYLQFSKENGIQKLFTTQQIGTQAIPRGWGKLDHRKRKRRKIL